VSIFAPTSAAQGLDFDRATPVGSRAEFDVGGGKFVLLEHEQSSRALRTTGSRIPIRFQVEDAFLDVRWAPIVGFSLASEDGMEVLQIDFADLPIYQHLGMSINRISYSPRKRTAIAQVQVPRFKRRDIQEIEIEIEPASSVAVLIDGKRRATAIDFAPHRLLIRPSGVKGWIEFVGPAVG